VDEGRTWHTVGVGLVEPGVTIDPDLLSGQSSVLVRVTASTGMRARSTTTRLAVEDL
jgi:hypothetical protein